MTRKQTILAIVLLAGFLGLGIGYIAIGSPDPTPIVFWIAFLIFAALFLRVLQMFVFDLVQYAVEGWNLDERRPRADMRMGKGGRGSRLSPRAIMYVGYPAFVIASGAAATILGLQAFRIIHIFY
jgi:hypothetical protein